MHGGSCHYHNIEKIGYAYHSTVYLWDNGVDRGAFALSIKQKINHTERGKLHADIQC